MMKEEEKKKREDEFERECEWKQKQKQTRSKGDHEKWLNKNGELMTENKWRKKYAQRTTKTTITTIPTPTITSKAPATMTSKVTPLRTETWTQQKKKRIMNKMSNERRNEGKNKR